MEMLKAMDFRSDTVTRPTAAMREAMASAPVGDDVYGDDPTVNSLQEYAAELLGMESGIYACSGTMGNLMAVMAHCGRGEGVLMGTASHTWKNEGGNIANIAGLMPYPLDDGDGIPAIDAIRAAFQPSGDVHYAYTTLLLLENTHNASGGIPIPVDTFAAVCSAAREMGLRVHVDGARLFNAAAYFGVDARRYTELVDSVQICLSKGLGAPMGSLLCGKRDFVERAKYMRKRLGGGQRQVGIAAAAGLIALRDMRARLPEDHANAALLAQGLENAGVDVENVAHRTNMVFFRLPQGLDGEDFAARCAARGLLLKPVSSGRVRMVTHLDVDEADVRSAVAVVEEVLRR